MPPTLPDGPIELLVVAEAPGQTEVDEGATLIGASGREIRRALAGGGFDPARAGYTNAMLCRPPGGDLERYTRVLKKNVKALEKEIGKDAAAAQVQMPIDCCRPRLKNELARARYAILMGGASLNAVQLGGSIMKLRGTPVQIPGGPPAMPIPHAAFVLRDTAATYRPVFRFDVAKAVRLSRGGNTWQAPNYFIATDPAQIENFLSRGLPFQAVDTETDSKDAWTCRLRRIGIGTTSEVMIYSPLSVHGHQMLPDHVIQASERAFANYFNTTTALLGFHNFFGFDSVVLGQHRMPVPDARVFDSLLGHSVGPTSELPHGLDFLGSIFTDAPRWKDDVKHSNVKDDRILDRYLSFDIAVTAAECPQVWGALERSQQFPIYNLDAACGAVGRNMSLLGVQIDRAKQFAFAQEYQEKYNRMVADFKAACGRDVNPASPVQLRKFLYEDLGLPILDDHLTDTDEPSTDEPTLLALLSMGPGERAEKIIHATLGFREADKVLSTYTGRVENGKLIDGPPVHGDMRLRTTWKPGRATGRWSSGDPTNMQNIIKKLRAMYVPADGNVFVAADYSALELRILALLSQDMPLVDAFTAFDAGTGPDIHKVNCCNLFRCTLEQVTDEIRDFIKRFAYGLCYGAGPPMIFRTLSLLRDDNLKPKFPHITMSEVERVYNLWWEAHPAMLDWQKKLIQGWRRMGYIGTPWHGRRRYFIGGENQEEMKNFPIQGGAADLQNQAVMALVHEYPFDFGRRNGLLLQVHDQLVVECPAKDAERVKSIVEWSMTRKIGGMLFPAKAKIGKTWKEVS